MISRMFDTGYAPAAALKGYWSRLLLGALCLPLFSSHALEGVQFKDGAFHAPLSAFKGDSVPMDLRGANAVQDISVPIPHRLHISKAWLELSFTNSIGVVDGSVLGVEFDQRPVAQLPLRGSKPRTSARMALPLAAMKPGYYDLSFAASQHYSQGCEDPTRASLWTKIDMEQSKLVAEAKLRPLNPVLSELERLVDPKLWSYYRLNILSPSALATQTVFEAGSLVAQGTALLLDYAPMGVQHQPLERLDGKLRDQRAANTVLSGIDFSNVGAGDVIVLGTRDSLMPYLRQDELNRISNGYFGIFPRPDKPEYFVLLVAGTSEDQLLDASKAMASGRLLLPYAQRAELDQLTLPPLPTRQARGLLMPDSDRKHRFSEFGFRSTTLSGMGAPGSSLMFWSQPDPFAPLKDTLDLEINAAYSGGMNSDSVLNLLLNGRYESALPLSDPKGGRYERMKISIPYAHLQPGWNELQLIADMKPTFMGGECQPIVDSHLKTTVFEQSTIRLNSRGDVTMLPDLDLLQRTGLPLAYEPDGQAMRVVLSSTSSGTLSAAWTLLGKLAQLNRNALTAADYSLNLGSLEDDQERSTLLLGVDASLPPSVAERLQFPNLRRSAQQPQLSEEAVTEFTFKNVLIGLLPESWQAWFGLQQTEQLERIYATAALNADFRKESAMLLMRDPQQKERSLVVVTSADSDKLATDVMALVQFEPWSRIAGDTVLWSADSDRPGLVRSARLTKPVDEDSIGTQRSIGYFFTQHPLLFLLLVLATIAALVLLTHYLLAKRQLRRQQNPGD
ncbi:hypothetical protein CHH28_04565 [Bacterioplanes sanyensis]|uniref:Cyclic di-GMP-binding protein n=1 Tax=Bacterioplanes sanyensis TaxID=1249553 RepID=A0A222FFY7_9GAMM|nr:cellulose biosynthesis cyclic di-GMP-binding regulatory protein BcsB [Bacterioplanes sanyensis]ASP37995.1 hypothetical protein CHH28_04565 [Bacterioplanes sanyensis]